MTESEMKQRTKQFALAVVRLVSLLKRGPTEDVIARQLARSGTSVGANYRSACRGRSRAEFAAKIAVAEEEADESGYWLELVRDAKMLPADEVVPLLKEAGELTAILASSARTARGRSSGPS